MRDALEGQLVSQLTSTPLSAQICVVLGCSSPPYRLPAASHNCQNQKLALVLLDWAPELSYTETNMSSFSTYLIGFFVLIIGLAIAAYLVNVPSTWILVGVVVALGIGILTATTRTKTKDPPGPPVA